jgi:hypothetical protein
MAVRWYIARNQQKIGPFSSAQLKQLADCGILQPSEHVLVEGGARWAEARTVPGLFATDANTKFWVNVAGQTRGPYVAEQIRAGLTTHQFSMDNQVYLEKKKQWVSLRQATEFHSYEPSSVSGSQAQLLAGSLDLEEARLHLAGKGGDDLAQLISVLMDLKRKHEKNPILVESLDRSLAVLKERRETLQAGRKSEPKDQSGATATENRE